MTRIINYFCVQNTHKMNPNQNIKIAVDAIVFAYKDKKLFVLLIKQKYGVFKNRWSLPGGLVLENEALSDAVHRELKEEAGISVNYLEQLFTFGDDVNRDPRNRVISVAYFALVNPSKLKLKADTDALDAKWFEIDNVPELPFDHNKILDKAFERIQAKLHYQPIGFDLLPNFFPFSDIENLYKTIFKQEIERRNFRKKMLSFGFIEETEKMQQTGSGRPAKLFQFNEKKYKALEKEGFHFEIKFA